MKKICVIKFGTASITDAEGRPDLDVIEKIALEVGQLNRLFHLILVSSGAVGAGKHFIQGFSGDLSQRKAAAAIGNPILIHLYAKSFQKQGLFVAQSLCERSHFSDRAKFLQLKSTFETLWKNQIIPIANENDVVSSKELQFTDNDELATLLAAGFGAEKLLICTKSGGLLDASGQIISTVEHVDARIFNLVNESLSSGGLGGMASKLTYTKKATALGIGVHVFGMQDGMVKALNGAGTYFKPQKANLSTQKKWMATSSIISAYVKVDAGAVKALRTRKSLLSVGVLEVSGEFEAGEVIDILDEQGDRVAYAKAKIDSRSFTRESGQILAHADHIVLE